MEDDRRGNRKMVKIETEEDYNNLVKLYVDWDKKTYGKNHRRISPPSAYFSWWKLCYKNDVDKHFAKLFEPRATKKQIGIERMAKELGFLDEDDYLWTGSLHYGLIFDKLWRKRNEYTLEEKYKVWLKRHPEASYRVRGDFEQ